MEEMVSEEVSSTTDLIRNHRSDWSLANDVALLEHLQKFSQKVLSDAHGVLKSLDLVESDLSLSYVETNTVCNRFLCLADNQFVENRVYEDEESELHSPQHKETPAEIESLILERLKESISNGLAVLDTKFEAVQILESDSEDDESSAQSALLLKPINLYSDCPPLPPLIGSEEFMKDDLLGYSEAYSEDETEISSSNAQSNSLVESGMASEDSEPESSRRDAQMKSPFNKSGVRLAEELAAKLGAVVSGADNVLKHTKNDIFYPPDYISHDDNSPLNLRDSGLFSDLGASAVWNDDGASTSNDDASVIEKEGTGKERISWMGPHGNVLRNQKSVDIPSVSAEPSISSNAIDNTDFLTSSDCGSVYKEVKSNASTVQNKKLFGAVGVLGDALFGDMESSFKKSSPTVMSSQRKEEEVGVIVDLKSKRESPSFFDTSKDDLFSYPPNKSNCGIVKKAEHNNDEFGKERNQRFEGLWGKTPSRKNSNNIEDDLFSDISKNNIVSSHRKEPLEAKSQRSIFQESDSDEDLFSSPKGSQGSKISQSSVGSTRETKNFLKTGSFGVQKEINLFDDADSVQDIFGIGSILAGSVGVRSVEKSLPAKYQDDDSLFGTGFDPYLINKNNLHETTSSNSVGNICVNNGGIVQSTGMDREAGIQNIENNVGQFSAGKKANRYDDIFDEDGDLFSFQHKVTDDKHVSKNPDSIITKSDSFSSSDVSTISGIIKNVSSFPTERETNTEIFSGNSDHESINAQKASLVSSNIQSKSNQTGIDGDEDEILVSQETKDLVNVPYSMKSNFPASFIKPKLEIQVCVKQIEVNRNDRKIEYTSNSEKTYDNSISKVTNPSLLHEVSVNPIEHIKSNDAMDQPVTEIGMRLGKANPPSTLNIRQSTWCGLFQDSEDIQYDTSSKPTPAPRMMPGKLSVESGKNINITALINGTERPQVRKPEQSSHSTYDFFAEPVTTTLVSATKERVRIPGHRRPQSRRARLNAFTIVAENNASKTSEAFNVLSHSTNEEDVFGVAAPDRPSNDKTCHFYGGPPLKSLSTLPPSEQCIVSHLDPLTTLQHDTLFGAPSLVSPLTTQTIFNHCNIEDDLQEKVSIKTENFTHINTNPQDWKQSSDMFTSVNKDKLHLQRNKQHFIGGKLRDNSLPPVLMDGIKLWDSDESNFRNNSNTLQFMSDHNIFDDCISSGGITVSADGEDSLSLKKKEQHINEDLFIKIDSNLIHTKTGIITSMESKRKSGRENDLFSNLKPNMVKSSVLSGNGTDVEVLREEDIVFSRPDTTSVIKNISRLKKKTVSNECIISSDVSSNTKLKKGECNALIVKDVIPIRSKDDDDIFPKVNLKVQLNSKAPLPKNSSMEDEDLFVSKEYNEDTKENKPIVSATSKANAGAMDEECLFQSSFVAACSKLAFNTPLFNNTSELLDDSLFTNKNIVSNQSKSESNLASRKVEPKSFSFSDSSEDFLFVPSSSKKKISFAEIDPDVASESEYVSSNILPTKNCDFGGTVNNRLETGSHSSVSSVKRKSSKLTSLFDDNGDDVYDIFCSYSSSLSKSAEHKKSARKHVPGDGIGVIRDEQAVSKVRSKHVKMTTEEALTNPLMPSWDSHWNI